MLFFTCSHMKNLVLIVKYVILQHCLYERCYTNSIIIIIIIIIKVKNYVTRTFLNKKTY